MARSWAELRPVPGRVEAGRLPTPHFQRSSGYLLVWLDHATEQDVRERLEDAWALSAPKRLLR